MGSSYVNLVNKFNQSFQVRIQADTDYPTEPKTFPTRYVMNQDRQMVPLGSMVRVRRPLGTELATRFNFIRPPP